MIKARKSKKSNKSKSSKAKSDDNPKKKMRSTYGVDIIGVALDGNCAPLREYLDNFDMTRAESEPFTKLQWETYLPAWKTKDHNRGLKTWKSKTARGQWNISGLCAKVVNQSVTNYMDIFGLPPVVEGERDSSDPSQLSAREEGMDLYTPFLLTVHRAYCQNLNPEVEPGSVAYDKVLQYMNTRPVRLKLLRSVRLDCKKCLDGAS